MFRVICSSLQRVAVNSQSQSSCSSSIYAKVARVEDCDGNSSVDNAASFRWMLCLGARTERVRVKDKTLQRVQMGNGQGFERYCLSALDFNKQIREIKVIIFTKLLSSVGSFTLAQSEPSLAIKRNSPPSSHPS